MTETEGSRTGQTHGGSVPRAFNRPIIPILRVIAYHTQAGMANTEWSFLRFTVGRAVRGAEEAS